MEDTQEKESAYRGKIKEWTEYPAKRLEELKAQAKEKGVNPEEIALGYIINTIVGDDPNSFLSVKMIGFERELSREVFERTNSRLEWEIGVAETPEEIKEQLRKVKEKLQGCDWDSKEGFDEGYEFWKENAQNWVLTYRNTHPEALAAYKSFLRFSGLAVEGDAS